MTTPTPTVIPVTPPRRKLVKFVRSKPGYRVSVLLNLLFLFSSLLYGIFTVISGTCIPALVKDSEEYFKFYECAGMFCFCAWNSLFMNILIIFPSVLTVHRERNLMLFALNGCSVFFIGFADYFRQMTRFQVFAAVLVHLFAYLLYMAIFNFLYAMPEDIHLTCQTASMRPWIPVYEDEAGVQTV